MKVKTWISIALFTGLFLNALAQDRDSYVLMVSFDGFRYDYVDQYNAPTFKQFRSQGAYAQGLICSFPTKTFPNHYTLVTGLYPGNHGLVDNTFYDGARNDTFSLRKRHLVEDAYFYGGLPLWQLVQEYGMKSASYFWVGSEAPVAGRYPDYYYRYDGAVANEERIQQVIEWFQLPDAERPQLVSLYFSFVDSEGHRSGPDSPQTGKAVLKADSLLAELLAGLDTVDLPIHVVLTSDHGMYPVQQSREFLLELPLLLGDFYPEIRVISSGTNVHLYVDSVEIRDQVYQSLKSKENHFTVYKKEETPEHWHYRDHPRIGDIILSAVPPYLFTQDPTENIPDSASTTGVHGYDPLNTPEMQGIFYAKGPKIQQGTVIEPFENVHVYPFIARLLGIQADTPDSNKELLIQILDK